MLKPSPRKSMGVILKDLIASPYFQGLSALAGLIAATVSDNLIIQIPALLILFGFLFALRSVIWHFVRSLATWLTWKFVLGVVVGILIGVTFFPFFESVLKVGVSSFIPQVTILETYPQDGETLSNLYDGISVNFSERIPSQYRSSPFLNIELTPNISVKRVWLYDYDIADCCRTLSIESAKYFPNARNPQFEPNTTYHLQISGLLIKNPIDLEFHTSTK